VRARVGEPTEYVDHQLEAAVLSRAGMMMDGWIDGRMDGWTDK
jgi:hypothetical protein